MLALFLLSPLAASAKPTDDQIRAQLESAVKAMETLLPKAEKDTSLQTNFRTALVALRAAQQARRAGKGDVALTLARKGEQTAQSGKPVIAEYQKEHGTEIAISNQRIPQKFSDIKGRWKELGQILPDSIMDQNKILPDSIMH
ncbi:MAG: hypothetical protein H6701_14060 [Myxococcales bacterium]|nr:hypothetical protein [Myxococcales bacterium]